MAELKKIASARPPNANYDLYRNPELPVVFVDGISAVGFGPLITKLEFFQSLLSVSDLPAKVTKSTDADAPPEERVVSLRVSIPTRALLELCVKTLGQLKTSGFEKVTELELDQVRALLQTPGEK